MFFQYTKQKREMLNLTVEDLARETGLTIEQINSFETDTLPTEEEMLLLANPLEIKYAIAKHFIRSMHKCYHRKTSNKPMYENYCLTQSQKNRNETLKKDLELAGSYRKELIPLIKAKIEISCTKWKFFDDGEYGNFDKLLLIRPSIIKAPVSRNVELPLTFDHIWTSLDVEYKNRVPNFRTCKELLVKGYIYEYECKGKKNLGLRTFHVIPVIRDEN